MNRVQWCLFLSVFNNLYIFGIIEYADELNSRVTLFVARVKQRNRLCYKHDVLRNMG